jgi:hypothetical protein
MGKYEPMARYLESREDDSWTATFHEIESKLGFTLPSSAHDHRAWWSNEKGSGHSQKEGWQSAGWETREVDLHRKIVRFERVRGPRPMSGNAAHHPGDPDLWSKAELITGITDRDRLMDMALTALIRREAGKQLALLGGTMPDFQVPPRDRPAR